MCFILTFHEPHVKWAIYKKPFYILTFLWSYPFILLRIIYLPPPAEGPKPHAEVTESIWYMKDLTTSLLTQIKKYAPYP